MQIKARRMQTSARFLQRVEFFQILTGLNLKKHMKKTRQTQSHSKTMSANRVRAGNAGTATTPIYRVLLTVAATMSERYFTSLRLPAMPFFFNGRAIIDRIHSSK